MRGPGDKEATLVAEEILWNVAKFLKKDPTVIKEMNFYQEGQKTPNGEVSTQ
jgi:xanthine dehydrogenase molybdopterin-binding subunit B